MKVLRRQGVVITPEIVPPQPATTPGLYAPPSVSDKSTAPATVAADMWDPIIDQAVAGLASPGRVPEPEPLAVAVPVTTARVTTPRNRLAHFAIDADARIAEIFAERQRRGLPFLFRFQIQINDAARRMYLAWPGQSASVRTKDLAEAKAIVKCFEQWQEAVDQIGVTAVSDALAQVLRDTACWDEK